MARVGDVVRYIGDKYKPELRGHREEEYAEMGLQVGDIGVVVEMSGPRNKDLLAVRFFNSPHPPSHADRGYWVMYPYELQVEESDGPKPQGR